ncbi:MAG: hypothetical protein KA214_01460 [Neisseriaceae bacterium]|nr:hypothetical protein [Neisseriaceae bacterium]
MGQAQRTHGPSIKAKPQTDHGLFGLVTESGPFEITQHTPSAVTIWRLSTGKQPTATPVTTTVGLWIR